MAAPSDDELISRPEKGDAPLLLRDFYPSAGIKQYQLPQSLAVAQTLSAEFQESKS